MATGKKKTILMYFLQKTSGTYSESSLAFLQDLLRREGIISGMESAQTTASELASFVSDGSYLKVSTKKIPEHIRAQIDFHLQKSRRSSKKSSSASSASAFDELLASIDSDDPKFSMDTTLGLDFSSLEELESDLKKHALDSLSPSLFAKERRNSSNPSNSSRMPSYSRESNDIYVPEVSDDVADVDEVYAQSRQASRLETSKVNLRADELQQSQHDISRSDISPSEITSEMLSAAQMGIQHGVPDFPNSNANSIHSNQMIPINSQSYSAQQNYSTQQNNNQPRLFSDSSIFSQKNEQQQMFNELQLRASLLDAKERLLSSRIGSSNDPAVLKAISMLDEKLLQFAQQQNANRQSLQQQNMQLQQQNAQFTSGSMPADSFSGLNLHSSSELSGKNSKSLSAQIKNYVQEIMSAQKSLSELGQLFATTSHQAAKNLQTTPVQQSQAAAQQITPAQVREMAKQEKQEVTKLRSQLSNLQEQFSQLSAQIVASQQSAQSAQSISQFRGKVRPMKTTAVHHHEIKSLVAPQRQLQQQQQLQELTEPESFGSDFSVNSPAQNVSNLQNDDFESDAPTLQKMYALLAVGMRELNVSPQRARHIYEQLQRLYTTLSFDQKPIIYPSIVEFYASLSNQMRGVQ